MQGLPTASRIAARWLHSFVAAATGMAAATALVALPVAAQSYDTHLSITARNNGTATNAIPAAGLATPPQMDFVVASPVLPPSATPVRQTLEAHWDNTRLPLKSLSGISYPQGWSLQYEVGGSWSAALPSDLQRVTGLQASGTIRSLGHGPAGGQAGQQVVMGSNVIATPAIPASIAIAANGDGWDVFFDPANTLIFNIFHHTQNGKMDCHLRSNGSTCPGWDTKGQVVPGGGITGNQATGVVLPDGRILVPQTNSDSQGGVACLTTAGIACSPAFVPLTTTANLTGSASISGLAFVDGKLYTLDQVNSTLLCFDSRTNTACVGENNWRLPGTGKSWMVSDSRYIYGYVDPGNATIFCYDVRLGAACQGWDGSQKIAVRVLAFFPLASNGVDIDRVCGYSPGTGYVPQCFDAGGQPSPVPPGLATLLTGASISAWPDYGNSSYAGGRSYWTEGLASHIYCYDANTDSACWSGGGFAGDNYTYTAVPDPTIPNCFWTNSDGYGITSWNGAGSTPVKGCGGIPATIKFSADANGVRMACPADNPVSAWQQFQLTGVIGASSAQLTVLNSAGAPVAGWSDLPAVNGGLGAALAGNAAAWDLTALTLAQSGQHPTFSVALPGMDHNVPVTANLQAVGSPAELCWSASATPGCPAATAPGLGAASGTVPLLAPPPSTFVTVSGSYGGSEGSMAGATSLTPASGALTQVAPAVAACFGSVSGTTRFNTTAVGLAGTTVSLVTADGAPVRYNGSPVTTTTATDGTYQFTNVLPNNAIATPSLAQQYAVSFAANASYPFVGTNTALVTATAPTVFSPGYTAAQNVLPLVSAPPAGSVAPPAGQLAAGQNARVTAFYSPTTALLALAVDASAARMSPAGSTAAAGSFSVRVSNISAASTSGSIVLTLQLPAGMGATPDGSANPTLTLVPGVFGNWSCAAAAADIQGQTVSCRNAPAPGSSNYSGMAGGVTLQLTFNVYIAGSDLSRTLSSSAAFVAGTMGGDVRVPNCASLLPPAGPAIAGNSTADNLCVQNRIGLMPNLGLSNSVASVNGAAASASTLLKPGDVVRYSNSATNNTAGVLNNINLTQTVPTGTNYTGIGEGWTCPAGTTGGNTCSWTQAALAAGASASTSFSVTLVAANLQSVSDSLTSSTPLAACTVTGNAACGASNLTVPQISISKVQSDAAGTASNAAVSAAGTTYFKVSLHNSGGAASFGPLGFTDTLPVGLSYYSTVSAGIGLQCSYNANTRVLACSGSTPLAAGASASVIYQVGVAANASGTLTNGVILNALGGDPRTTSAGGLVGGASGNSSNGTAAQTALLIQPVSSLVVSQVLTQILRAGVAIANPTTAVVQAGDVLTYTLTAQAVTSAYNGVVLTDTLPAHTHYSGAGVASDGSWACNAATGTAPANCTQSINVAANRSVNTTFTVTVDALGVGDTAISNAVAPGNPGGSANISLPTCTACTTSNPTPPYLSLRKEGPAALVLGASSRYSVTLQNTGGSASSGLVSFSDVLPPGVWFDGALQSDNGFVCSALPATASSPAQAQTLSCSNSATALNPGASVTVMYAVTAQASAAAGAAALVNQASLVGGAMGGDPHTPAPCSLADPATAGASASQTDGGCAKAAASLSGGSPSFVVAIASIQRGATRYTSANLPAGIASLAALPVAAGDVLTYSVTGTNATASASQAVTVQHGVPGYTHFTGGVIAGGNVPAWSCAAGAVAGSSCYWDVGSIPAQSSVSAEFVVTVGTLPQTAATRISNSLVVSNTGGAGGVQPVCLVCAVVLPTVPRLQLSAQFSALGVAPLNNVSLLVTLRNLGGASTTGSLAFSARLPQGLLLSGSNVSVNGFHCTGDAGLPQALACSSINGLAEGDSTTITLPLVAASGITGNNLNAQVAATAIANDARAAALPVASLLPATVGANVQASVVNDASGLYVNAAINALYGTLTPKLTLYQVQRAGAVFATDAGASGLQAHIVQPGDGLTYRLRLSEAAGTSTTTELTQTVPANTSYSGNAAAPEGWSGSCAAAGSSCTQTITVNGGGVRDVYFTNTAASSFAAGVLALTDTVLSSANPSCGVACSVRHATPPLLSIALLANQPAIASSTEGSFAVSLRNSGGSSTSGPLGFSLTLPDGLAFSSVSGSVASCSAVGSLVHCSVAESMLSGASLALALRVSASGAGGTFGIALAALAPDAMGGDVRSGFVTTGSNLAADPLWPANASTLAAATVAASGLSAKALVAITPAPALSVVQSGFAAPLVAGVSNSLSVTLSNAANAGNATGASVALALPAGWSTDSITGAGWACTHASGAPLLLPVLGPSHLLCTYSQPMAAGSSATSLMINGTPTAATVGTLLSLASTVDAVGGSHPPVPGGVCPVPGSCASSSGTVGSATGPLVTLAFSEPSLNLGGSTVLLTTLANPTGSGLEGVGLSIPLPAGLTLARLPALANSCGGTFVLVNQVPVWSGATVPAGQSCVLRVTLTTAAGLGAPASVQAVIPANALVAHWVNSNASVSNAAPATASLQVIATVTVNKQFSSPTAVAGAAVRLTLTLHNGTAFAASDLGLTDLLPSAPGAMRINNPANASTTCAAGVLSATAGDAALGIRGAQLAAGASCTLSADVVAPLGAYTNTIAQGDVAGQLDGMALAGSPAAVALLSVGQGASIGGIARHNGTPLAGITVALLDNTGQPVFDASGHALRTTSGADGSYAFSAIAPSVLGDPASTYGLQFYSPADSHTVPNAVPQHPDPQVNGTANADRIVNITALDGVVTQGQNVNFVDPQGIVYNSVTRQAVAGSVVTLVDAGGSPVPNACLDTQLGTANGTPTPASGNYVLLMLSSCLSPTPTLYHLQVTPPLNGYRPALSAYVPSAFIAPGPVYTPNGAANNAVQAQATPPTGNQPTTYYTSFFLASNLPGLINNHLPQDALPQLHVVHGAVAFVPGSSSEYTISVSNGSSGGPTVGVSLMESIPTGTTLNRLDGSGWACSLADGSALALPARGPLALRCYHPALLATAASLPLLTVGITPDLALLGQTTAVFTVVAAGNLSNLQLLPVTDAAACLAAAPACASSSGVVALTAASLMLQKNGSASSVELGDSLLYTLTLRHSAGAPQSQVVVTDTLPRGFKYIPNTVRLVRSGSTSSSVQGDAATGVRGVGPVLNFGVGNLQLGDSVSISYRVRVGVGAQQGDGINRAMAHTAAHQQSNEARFQVKVSDGVFTTSSCVIGKVFVDCNGSGLQTSASTDPGIPGVRLYLEDGTHIITDSQGKYAVCGLKPTSHVLKLDPQTLPSGARLVTSANRNALDPDSLFVDSRFGELARADFVEGSCSPGVLQAVRGRQQQAVAASEGAAQAAAVAVPPGPKAPRPATLRFGSTPDSDALCAPSWTAFAGRSGTACNAPTRFESDDLGAAK